jgi:hypothetical protein
LIVSLTVKKISLQCYLFITDTRIVFIWPASVPWGAIDKGVALGFCKAYNYLTLIQKLKKLSAGKYFIPYEIHHMEIKQLLYEAVLLDEQDFKSRIKK